ncbi:MAG: LysR substrate-binding domain-containing protein [Pseudomonadota bacterium]|nr:LysR substrate-binding domain-containing protein [Pseudomonadota bacterium]
MQNITDFAYFAAAARHSGIGHASRALGVPEADIHRAVARLQALAGQPLVERATQLFAVTPAGQALLQHAEALLAHADAAQALLDAQGTDPRGTVRLACPPALLLHAVGPMLADSLRAWPQLRLQVLAHNRNVDVTEEAIDMAVRVRAPGAPTAGDELIEPLALCAHLLVCAPGLLQDRPAPRTPADLAGLPTLGLGNSPEQSGWLLTGPGGETDECLHEPRLVVDDMAALIDAATAGLGCAVVSHLVARKQLQSGALVPVLPGWQPPPGLIHAVCTPSGSRRPAVRRVLDTLTEGFAELARQGIVHPPGEGGTLSFYRVL